MGPRSGPRKIEVDCKEDKSEPRQGSTREHPAGTEDIEELLTAEAGGPTDEAFPGCQ